MSKLAVVLMNLGGPDSLSAVEPFLFNLFSDPAIIPLSNPLRWLLAKIIARQRGPLARQIYAKIGNGSPLLRNTEMQAAALEARLGMDCRVFIAMRYWAPRADDVAQAVRQWGADEIVLLPLYPQFSSTTTGSSVKDWQRAAVAAGLSNVSSRAICCYPIEAGFIASLAAAIRTGLRHWPADQKAPRVLLSAHGLPKRIVARGDPYKAHVEQTAAKLGQATGVSGLEMVVCYQSRVGPVKWIGPATDAEVRRAGEEGRGLIVVPVAFVSEHSETLVELDIEYRHLAAASGVPYYMRVPAVGTSDSFIAGLAALVNAVRSSRADGFWAEGAKPRCHESLVLCPNRAAS